MRPRRFLFLCSLAALTSCADADSDDPQCLGGKCDDADDAVPSSPCDGTLIDRSGRTNPDGSPIKKVAGRLGDPLAKLVYMTEGCPTTFEDIMAKLEMTDATDCVDLSFGEDDGVGVAHGTSTAVVNESAQLDDAKGGLYRTVTTRQCGGREPFGLVFSNFGLDPDGADIPPEVEIMGFDQTAGVFNYYKDVGGKMAFFGSSVDLVTRGPAGPGVTDVRGCANCHTGGGMIMKELQSPWMHWEGDFTTPGAEDLVGNRKALLGRASSGIELEGTTRSGNTAWNTRRIELMRTQGSVADLLRPLFCPIEVNIGSGASTALASNLVLDPLLGFVSVFADDFEAAEVGYTALKQAVGQVVPGHPGKDDTISPFGFLERAGSDIDYVEQLMAAEIVDQAFVRDVLMVDFTRPLFSDQRCDLLAFAPELSPPDRSAETIRAGFVAALTSGAPGPEGQQLLAFLSARNPARPVIHQFATKGFENACTARTETITVGAAPVRTLFADALKLRSLQRKIGFRDRTLDNLKGSAAHSRPLFEFADTLATDAIEPSTGAAPDDLMAVHPDARLSPTSCELVSGFVPVAPQEVETFGDCSNDDGASGVCVDIGNTTCPTRLETGHCPGLAPIQCCILSEFEFGD